MNRRGWHRQFRVRVAGCGQPRGDVDRSYPNRCSISTRPRRSATLPRPAVTETPVRATGGRPGCR